MCGRIVRVWDPALEMWVVQSDAAADLEAERELRRSRYNIAPVTPVLVAQADDARGGRPRLSVARWGFDVAGITVCNTRAEDAGGSRLWAPLVDAAQHHAVVPATGFYEWTTRAGSRLPHYIRRADGKPMLLAALASVREVAGARRLCVSILTTEPQPAVRALHDRMPVYLEAGDVDAWLRPEPGTFRRLTQVAAVPLKVHEVATKVNKAAGVDGPELIEPVARQTRLG